MLTRRVEAELLDELPPDDPRALHSRNDLRRINNVMRNASILAGWLNKLRQVPDPLFLVELGAGDGTALLEVARRTALGPGKVQCLLIDRQRLLTSDTRDRFKSLSWEVEAEQADVFDWVRRPAGPDVDVAIANLFLHHFTDARLRILLAEVGQRAAVFLACEPLRSRMAFAAASMTGLIGGNEVTFHDARLSVRAGFDGQELSALWPADGWTLTESRAGLFTHGFQAYRAAGPSASPLRAWAAR